jgi:hypothetical protein
MVSCIFPDLGFEAFPLAYLKGSISIVKMNQSAGPPVNKSGIEAAAAAAWKP